MTTSDTAPILLCYDGSADSIHAVVTAGKLFRGHTAIVLHVWSPIAVIASAFGGLASLPDYDDQVLQEAALKLAAAGARVAAAAGLNARAEVTEVTFDGAASRLRPPPGGLPSGARCRRCRAARAARPVARRPAGWRAARGGARGAGPRRAGRCAGARAGSGKPGVESTRPSARIVIAS